MSIPEIPGYTSRQNESLASLWQRPAGTYPLDLWPTEVLEDVVPTPTEWITVEAWHFDEHQHGGRSSILVTRSDVNRVLVTESWIGRDLGTAGVSTDHTGRRIFEDGLSSNDGEIQVEFLTTVRGQHGLRPPVVDISLPFLWYWDAIKINNGWNYLSRSGQDRPLIRTTINEDVWSIEIRALELRRFLADTQRALVVQVDHVTKCRDIEIDEYDECVADDWVSFDWYCRQEPAVLEPQAFSRLLGKYVVDGSMLAACPPWDYRKDDATYPRFKYGVDSSSGSALEHSCDPAELGTYFDQEPGRLHYLTPICFDREVLSKYLTDPLRYEVGDTRISCLDLWSVNISRNTAGHVEVYLGDIGRDMPSEEWPHWLAHNILPEGTMDEARFRRDFLGQPAGAATPIEILRAARIRINSISTQVLGGPLWRELKYEDKIEFDRLYPPVSRSPQSLKLPVLSLAKSIVETIDARMLREFLNSDDKDARSLGLLESLIQHLGGEKDIVEPLRALQDLRSKGGIAHLAGDRSVVLLERMGIRDLDPEAAFNHIVGRLLVALEELERLLNRRFGGASTRLSDP